MKRRDFVRICTSVAALAATGAPVQGAETRRFKRYAPAELVDTAGHPLDAAKLKTGTNYLFHYPYVGTPALLIRLPAAPTGGISLRTADMQDYRWPGGVGPGGRLVAYAAICPHQLSAALKDTAVISHRARKSPVSGRDHTIVCCAHHSVFDPMRGGAVMSGPAPQPLTAIVLEHDKQGRLYAVGTLGGELFDRYFRAYRRELIREFGRGAARRQTPATTVVRRLEDYAAAVVRC